METLNSLDVLDGKKVESVTLTHDEDSFSNQLAASPVIEKAHFQAPPTTFVTPKNALAILLVEPAGFSMV